MKAGAPFCDVEVSAVVGLGQERSADIDGAFFATVAEEREGEGGVGGKDDRSGGTCGHTACN